MYKVPEIQCVYGSYFFFFLPIVIHVNCSIVRFFYSCSCLHSNDSYMPQIHLFIGFTINSWRTRNGNAYGQRNFRVKHIRIFSYTIWIIWKINDGFVRYLLDCIQFQLKFIIDVLVLYFRDFEFELESKRKKSTYTMCIMICIRHTSW